jgi:hypothetical protein
MKTWAIPAKIKIAPRMTGRALIVIDLSLWRVWCLRFSKSRLNQGWTAIDAARKRPL